MIRSGIAFLLLLSGVTLCVGQGVTEDAREWKVSDDLTVRELDDGVWMHTSWQVIEGGIRFPGNGLLVRDGDELILVDTAWGADLTEQLLDWIDDELLLPVALAVATHFHEDSMGGAPVLAARGIPVLAHPLSVELRRERGMPLPHAIGDMDVGDALLVGSVEVFYPGHGHSADNVVVWIPEARVLFGGCAVRATSFTTRGNTADADLEEWPRAIRRVLERYPTVRTVVPGHGAPGGAELLTHTIAVVEE